MICCLFSFKMKESVWGIVHSPNFGRLPRANIDSTDRSRPTAHSSFGPCLLGNSSPIHLSPCPAFGNEQGCHKMHALCPESCKFAAAVTSPDEPPFGGFRYIEKREKRE